jgi:uncharacterized alkaline shock family protein YloU
MATNSTGQTRKRKLERVAEKRDIGGISNKIHEKWVNTDATLKDLRDQFNRAVLESAMKDAGMDIAPGEVEYTYRHISPDDNVTLTNKKETEMRLTKSGINVEKITDNFINSPQTILNYLRAEYDVERRRRATGDVDIEQEYEYIKPLNRRYENVVTTIIDRLSKSNELEHNNFDVSVECVITDNKNNQTKKLSDVLEGGA